MQAKPKGSRFKNWEKILGWCWVLFTTALAHADPPTITSQEDSIIYREAGSVLNLTCSVQNLTIAWYHENVPLETAESGSALQHRIYDDRLEISNLSFEQAGWYTCAASNLSGRAEREFLVVVGEQPRITFQLTQPIRVEEMTRVEIPCIAEGFPYPEVKWFNDTDEVNDGDFDGRYRIDSTTNSLVIYNFTSTDVQRLGFNCTVTNVFGTDSSSRVRVEILVNSGSSNLQSPFNDLPSLIGLTTTENYELPCTNLSSAEISQLNFNWTRNLSELTTADRVILNGSRLDTTGYYCCSVFQLQNGTSTTLNTYCVTVVVRTEARFDTTSNNTSVQAGRTVNLHCQGNTPNRFDPPSFHWNRNNIQLQPSTPGSVTVSQTNLGMSYLSINETWPEDAGVYTCTGRNNLSTIARNITVHVVDTCTLSDNELRDHNAEEENPLSSWSPSDMNASFTTISNERVFTVTYNSSGPEFSRLVQTLTVPINTTRAYVSGRIRHTARPLVPGSSPGVALINVTLDEGQGGFLEQPFPSLDSWQWVGRNYSISEEQNMSVVLTVRRGEGEGHIQGTAYFDDLCVSFAQESSTPPEPTTQAPPPGLTFNIIIAISAGAGGGAFLLLFLILLLCTCCCRRSSKNAATPMRKMSTIIKMRFSKSISKSEMHTSNPPSGRHDPQEVESSFQNSKKDSNKDSKEDYVEPYTDIHQSPPTYTPLDRNLLASEHLYMSATPHANGDDLEPDALRDKEYSCVEHGSTQIHQLIASSQPNQQNKTEGNTFDPITGEIYSYVNEEIM